jgi:hypothetical protein
MADEFAKGLGIFTAGSLAWMVLAAWYRTSSFGSSRQLIEPVALESATFFDSVGILLMDALFWFTLIGAFTFWVFVPLARQVRETVEEREA